MFESFFPKPKLFFSSLIIWISVLIAVWYLIGSKTGLLLGVNLIENGSGPVIGLGHFITPEFLWFDLYYIIGTSLFFGFWRYYNPHQWQNWSVLGSALLIFLSYASVQVSVVINAWYGPFYDDIQKGLAGTNEVSAMTLYSHLIVFCTIAFPYIGFMIANKFFTSHYIFRWRNAMNDHYVKRWSEVRHIEGA